MGTVFWDLDGTLTDPKPGITGSVVKALHDLGLDAPSPDELEWVIGPALLWSFEKAGDTRPGEGSGALSQVLRGQRRHV